MQLVGIGGGTPGQHRKQDPEGLPRHYLAARTKWRFRQQLHSEDAPRAAEA